MRATWSSIPPISIRLTRESKIWKSFVHQPKTIFYGRITSMQQPHRLYRLYRSTMNDSIHLVNTWQIVQYKLANTRANLSINRHPIWFVLLKHKYKINAITFLFLFHVLVMVLATWIQIKPRYRLVSLHIHHSRHFCSSSTTTSQVTWIGSRADCGGW